MNPARGGPGPVGTTVLALAFATLFAVVHVAHCAADVAPPPWDEAYLLLYPTRVADALHHDGVFAAIGSWYSHSFFKSPLSMLGTTPALLLGCDGPVGVRVDNLVVALLGAVFTARLLRPHVGARLATASAVASLGSPFVLGLVRTELAEIWQWTVTLLFLGQLLRPASLGSLRSCGLLGVWLGVGTLAKLSFPMTVAGPVAVVLLARARSAHREGTLRRLLAHIAVMAFVATALVFAVCGKSVRHMVAHLREQYGWVGEQYGGGESRWRFDFFAQWCGEWTVFVGWPWLAAGGIAALVLLWRCRRRIGLPLFAVALLAGTLLNLATCYFFPVVDPRFTVGACACLLPLVCLGVARAIAPIPWLVTTVPWLAVALAAARILANSYVAATPSPILPAGWLHSPIVNPPPCRDADLRDAVLAAVARAPLPHRVGLAGDHRSLNLDNLRLRALARHQQVQFVQIGYFAPELTLDERLRRAGDVDCWLLVVPPHDGGLWTTRLARPVRAHLDAAPARYPPSALVHTFTDGSEVRLYHVAAGR